MEWCDVICCVGWVWNWFVATIGDVEINASWGIKYIWGFMEDITI